VINLEFNYDYNGRIYKIKTERKEDTYTITYDDTNYTVTASEVKPGYLNIKLDDKLIKAVISEQKKRKYVFLNGNVYNIVLALQKTKKIDKKDDLISPISGKVVKFNVCKGDLVKTGDVLLVIEAMKMEYLIKAPHDGRVTKIYFKPGDQIDMGAKPLDINKEDK
jgi:3-methylcrotonyl-CoA carboxylase alpha subunit